MKKGKPRVTIDDSFFSSKEPPEKIRRIREFCEALPDGKALTTRSLTGNLGYEGFSDHATHPVLAPYSVRMKYKGTVSRIWGNPKTIKMLRDEQEAEGND